jgi:hypothetical protein
MTDEIQGGAITWNTNSITTCGLPFGSIPLFLHVNSTALPTFIFSIENVPQKTAFLLKGHFFEMSF